jgi:hypothetical protein
MALLLLFLGLAWQIMLPALRVWRVNQAQATIEENALVMSTTLVRDMERSTQASLTVAPASGTPLALQAVSFATVGEENSPDSYDAATGQPIWQTYVIYYILPGSHTLMRKVWPVPGVVAQTPPLSPPQGLGPAPPGALPYTMPNSQPVALAQNDLVTLCQTPNGSERSLGGNVDTFLLTPSTTLSSCGILTLGLSTPTPFGITNHVTSTQRVEQFHFWM